MYELLQGALKYGAYTQEPDGTVGGMFYRQFTEYTSDVHQLTAEVVTDLTPDRLAAESAAGHLVITSVHKKTRRPGRPAPGRRGTVACGRNGREERAGATSRPGSRSPSPATGTRSGSSCRCGGAGTVVPVTHPTVCQNH